MPAEQLQFFPSLDFPGRTTVLLWEMAERLGVSDRHLSNEVDSGALVVLDLKAGKSPRRCLRVPIECYRDYIVARLTGPVERKQDLIRNLPKAVRMALIRELQESLTFHG